MWPYQTRGSRFMGDIRERFPSQLDGTDFSVNAAVIKLWLPDKLLAAIDVMCDVHDTSRPDVLRGIFFEHAFGRAELALLKRRSELPKPVDEARVLRSARRGAVAEPSETIRAINARFLGKATEDLKLHLPVPLKDELAALARAQALPLSDYLRGVLARQLLGERLYRAWQDALARANAMARLREADFRPVSAEYQFVLAPSRWG